MKNPAIQLWAEDEVHFQKHSSIMHMWSSKQQVAVMTGKWPLLGN
jgi:hypothetical protein